MHGMAMAVIMEFCTDWLVMSLWIAASIVIEKLTICL